MIGFIVFGLVVGILARVVVPGRQHLSVGITLVLGLIGSVVGGVGPTPWAPATSSNSTSSARSWPSQRRSC